MGLFSRKEKPMSCQFTDDKTNTVFILKLLDDHLQIGLPLAKPDQLKTLRYDQIKDVVYTSEIEKVAKSKSPIGRAIMGGVLFGGAGAVVGAVSGTGSKEKKEYKFYFIINYTSKDGEDKFLQYQDKTLGKGLKFSKALKEKAGIVSPEHSNEL